MQLLLDKEAENVVIDLCNVALMQGGIKNLQVVNAVLNNIKQLPETPTENTINPVHEKQDVKSKKE